MLHESQSICQNQGKIHYLLLLGIHPYLREDLSLNIEVHDETIWKSIPEL